MEKHPLLVYIILIFFTTHYLPVATLFLLTAKYLLPGEQTWPRAMGATEITIAEIRKRIMLMMNTVNLSRN